MPEPSTLLDRLTLPTPCQHCKAPAGQWCVTRHGWSARLHKARTDPVEAAYSAGVQAGRRAASGPVTVTRRRVPAA